MNDITYVGLDVHKATVCVAIAESGRGGEVREVGVFENRPVVLRKMVARLGKHRRRLNFCYEAGPCGYGLHRLLTGLGHDCVVVAPSSRRSWSPPRSPARWSASSGRSPALHSLSSSNQATETEPTKGGRLKSEVHIAGGRTTVGNPRACYEPVPGPMLDSRARQPRDGTTVMRYPIRA